MQPSSKNSALLRIPAHIPRVESEILIQEGIPVDHARPHTEVLNATVRAISRDVFMGRIVNRWLKSTLGNFGKLAWHGPQTPSGTSHRHCGVQGSGDTVPRRMRQQGRYIIRARTEYAADIEAEDCEEDKQDEREDEREICRGAAALKIDCWFTYEIAAVLGPPEESHIEPPEENHIEKWQDQPPEEEHSHQKKNTKLIALNQLLLWFTSRGWWNGGQRGD